MKFPFTAEDIQEHPEFLTRSWVIMLDGKAQRDVVSADEEKGEVVVHEVGPDGFYQWDAIKRTEKVRVLTGSVRIAVTS